MATLASTNITSNITYNGEVPLAYGTSGLQIEIFRCASGAVGDTIAITPRFLSGIYSYDSGMPATSNLSTTGSTNVTLTLAASASTSATFDVWLLGKRSTT